MKTNLYHEIRRTSPNGTFEIVFIGDCDAAFDYRIRNWMPNLSMWVRFADGTADYLSGCMTCRCERLADGTAQVAA